MDINNLDDIVALYDELTFLEEELEVLNDLAIKVLDKDIGSELTITYHLGSEPDNTTSTSTMMNVMYIYSAAGYSGSMGNVTLDMSNVDALKLLTFLLEDKNNRRDEILEQISKL